MRNHVVIDEVSGTARAHKAAGAPVILIGASEPDVSAQIEEALAKRRLIGLSSLADPDIQLRMPLFVEMVLDGQSVVVTSEELSLYAVAESEPLAIRAFRSALLEDFEYLQQHEAILGSDLAAKLTVYRDLLQPRAR